jgi:Zn-dependent peptidase ImmA (M78 family)
LASAARIPFGFLFLAAPPEEKLPLPDLRTVGSSPLSQPSVDLLDTVRNTLLKQSWYQEYLKQQGQQALDFVGSISVDAPVKQVAKAMHTVLQVDKKARTGTGDEYLTALIAAADRGGILVMRNGVVGNNTRRRLDVSEFRGFAVADQIAPLVFINNADALKARLFTLAHELAHLWIGSSGISSLPDSASRREERFCNAVAGEFLAPEDEFRKAWDGRADWRENIGRLVSIFHVSNLVIARRARDLGFIDEQTHNEYYRSELESFRRTRKLEGGGHADMYTRNGKQFSQAVVREALTGKLLMRDAARLLDISPSSILTCARESTNVNSEGSCSELLPNL